MIRLGEEDVSWLKEIVIACACLWVHEVSQVRRFRILDSCIHDKVLSEAAFLLEFIVMLDVFESAFNPPMQFPFMQSRVLNVDFRSLAKKSPISIVTGP